jgi:hypothetical protein
MEQIIMEGVLFVALLAAMVALFTWVLHNFTPLGTRRRQLQNRKQIERAAARECPVHGVHEEHELVLLPSGERICPECYREAVNGYTG